MSQPLTSDTLNPVDTGVLDTVVVGAGISGLALAFGLQRAGQKVVLLERSPHVGGTLRTFTHEGCLLETGANAFLDREPATRRLLQSVNLEDAIRPADASAKRRFLVHQGKLCAAPAHPAVFFSSPLLSARGKLRVLAEPFSRRGPGSDESLATLSRRHIGDEATRTGMDAAQLGIFAGDVEALSARSALPKLAELEHDHRSWLLGLWRGRKNRPAPPATGRLCSLEGGLGVLPQALASALGNRVLKSTEVTRIFSDATNPEARFTVQTANGQTWRSKNVALAIPAFAAAPLLRPLSADAAKALEEIRYAPLAAVHVGLSAASAEKIPPGFGFLAPSQEGLDLLGVIFISKIFPWRVPAGQGLLTAMVGGVKRAELVALDDASLGERVRSALAQVVGLVELPSFVRIVRWERAIPQYNVGHSARLHRLDEGLKAVPGLFLLGNAYRGVGINDCVRDAERMIWRITQHIPRRG